jgi:hypothetical protein
MIEPKFTPNTMTITLSVALATHKLDNDSNTGFQDGIVKVEEQRDGDNAYDHIAYACRLPVVNEHRYGPLGAQQGE